MISKQKVIVKGSRNLGEALFTSLDLVDLFSQGSFSLVQYRKNNFFILSKDIARLYQDRSILIGKVKDLGCSCLLFRLGKVLRRVVEQTESTEYLTAYSQRMCGQVVRWSNKINSLCLLSLKKCAVRFGFGQDLRSGQGDTPLEKYQSKGRTAPPLLYINCSCILRVFIDVLCFKIVGFIFFFSFVFEKWGARGEFQFEF